VSPGIRAARGGDARAAHGSPAVAPAGHAERTGAERAHHRIFIAVALAPVLREAIALIQHRLAVAGADLRWIPPENLHLTLKFLGAVTTPRLARVTEAVHDAASRTRSFTITLGGLGAFPSARRPRVVWVGVTEGADRLSTLAGDLDIELGRRRFPREHRPFQSHLTIARVRSGGPPPDLSELLAGLHDLALGSQPVEAMFVMESMLHPSGAIYHPVEEAVLRGTG